MASKWGDPEVGIERDLSGRPIAASMLALDRATRERAAKEAADAAQYEKDMARNRRIDYWGQRGLASWQEPDYEGENQAERLRKATDIGTNALRERGQIEGELDAQFEPGKYARKNQADLERARNEDINYWDPRHQSRLADDFERRYKLATSPATIAAESRQGVASTQAGAKLGAAGMEQSTDALAALAKLIGAGMFGTDPRTGDTIAPPPEATNQIMEALRRAMAGGGEARTFDPKIEGEISQAMQATGASRPEVIAHFEKIGKIR